LKPSFNKSGQNSFPAPETAHRCGRSRVRKQQGRDMAGILASIISASLSSPATGRDRQNKPLAEIRSFWRQFFVRAFDPYRPELHYMRGPGPACRAKQTALSPVIQSMVAEIRAAKTLKSPLNKALKSAL
jgi:hypothetical protein